MTLSLRQMRSQFADIVPWNRRVAPWRRVSEAPGGLVVVGAVAVAAAGAALLALQYWRRSRAARGRSELVPAVSRWEGEGGQIVDEYAAS